MKADSIQIQIFSPEFEKKVEALENSLVSTSYLGGVVKISREFQVPFSSYFSENQQTGFILIAINQQNDVLAKAVFRLKTILLRNIQIKAVVIQELRNISTSEVINKLVFHGIQKAKKEFECQIAYIYCAENIQNQLTDFYFFQSIQSALCLSATNSQSVLHLSENKLSFEMLSPYESEQLLASSSQQDSLVSSSSIFSSEEAKQFVFRDEKKENIYSISLFIDDKKYSPNFSRFGFSSSFFSNKILIRTFFVVVNLISLMLLLFIKNEQKDGDSNPQIILKIMTIIGLNIGICMAFFQINKTFKKFSGSIGRVFNFYHNETSEGSTSQSKRREIFQALINNAMSWCTKQGVHQIRVDANIESDYWDFLEGSSVFRPYSTNKRQLLIASLNQEKMNIKDFIIDPRDF